MANRVDGETSERAFHKAQCYPLCCSTCAPTNSPFQLPPTVSSTPTTCALPPNIRPAFEQVENTLDSGLNELGAYYKENHPLANPAKTQLTAFHLKNRQADRKLNVTWNGTKLDHTHSPVYLSITLDRSITYRNHCLKTRAKLSSSNNVLRKMHGTNWGACPRTMKTTATALCLSVAEYCCPVWARSTHRKLVDTTLNETCRLITVCIRPTATPDLYVLSGIAPTEIRRSVHSQNERTKQLTDQRHSLHYHQPVKSRLYKDHIGNKCTLVCFNVSSLVRLRACSLLVCHVFW